MASGRFAVVKNTANLEIELNDDTHNQAVKENKTELIAKPDDEKQEELLTEVIKALNIPAEKPPIKTSVFSLIIPRLSLDRVVKKLIKIGFQVFSV